MVERGSTAAASAACASAACASAACASAADCTTNPVVDVDVDVVVVIVGRKRVIRTCISIQLAPFRDTFLFDREPSVHVAFVHLARPHFVAVFFLDVHQTGHEVFQTDGVLTRAEPLTIRLQKIQRRGAPAAEKSGHVAVHRVRALYFRRVAEPRVRASKPIVCLKRVHLILSLVLVLCL